VAYGLISSPTVDTVLGGGPSEMTSPREDRPQPQDDPEEAPETPTDEPKPVPVQDPPAEPSQPPYVVTGDQDGQQSESRS
jgi:hypothetical protein